MFSTQKESRPLYPGSELPFGHDSAHKNLFSSEFFSWDFTNVHIRLTKILNLLEPLVMQTRTCGSYFVISKYIDYMQ